MKVFLAAFLAAAVLAVAFGSMLDTTWQRQVDEQYASTTGVRLPSHGSTHNLVGKDWFSAQEH